MSRLGIRDQIRNLAPRAYNYLVPVSTGILRLSSLYLRSYFVLNRPAATLQQRCPLAVAKYGEDCSAICRGSWNCLLCANRSPIYACHSVCVLVVVYQWRIRGGGGQVARAPHFRQAKPLFIISVHKRLCHPTWLPLSELAPLIPKSWIRHWVCLQRQRTAWWKYS